MSRKMRRYPIMTQSSKPCMRVLGDQVINQKAKHS